MVIGEGKVGHGVMNDRIQRALTINRSPHRVVAADVRHLKHIVLAGSQENVKE